MKRKVNLSVIHPPGQQCTWGELSVHISVVFKLHCLSWRIFFLTKNMICHFPIHKINSKHRGFATMRRFPSSTLREVQFIDHTVGPGSIYDIIRALNFIFECFSWAIHPFRTNEYLTPLKLPAWLIISNSLVAPLTSLKTVVLLKSICSTIWCLS